MHRGGTYNGNSHPASKPAAKPTSQPAASQPTGPTHDDLVTAAQQTVKTARTALNQLTAQLKTQYEQSPDFTAAVTQQKQSQDAYNSAYQADVVVVHGQADYKQALQDKTDAQKKIDQLHQSGSSGPELIEASQASLAASQKLAQLESNAASADPRMATLKAAVADANTKLATMRKNFDATLPANTYWAAAKKDLDDAQAKLDQLQKETNN